jgi:hypothetical protein
VTLADVEILTRFAKKASDTAMNRDSNLAVLPPQCGAKWRIQVAPRWNHIADLASVTEGGSSGAAVPTTTPTFSPAP